MSASGKFPVPEVAGEKLTLGAQTYSFDGKTLSMAKVSEVLK
jgi:hypothetical protein